MREYKTSELAQLTGIHANTVRLYESIGFITKAQRAPNGYRVFTDLQLEQIRLVRMALQVEVLQNGLRKQAVAIIRAAAGSKWAEALELSERYLGLIRAERARAEEAISVATSILKGHSLAADAPLRTRSEVAGLLGISMDSLRNWEMNGLLSVKRKQNGYRVYSDEDLRRLKIIRSLRAANYSLAAILRMLNALSASAEIDIRAVIDTPQPDEDIISVCDKLLSSLQSAEQNALAMQRQLACMCQAFGPNPPL